jgi:hypothetical protein
LSAAEEGAALVVTTTLVAVVAAGLLQDQVSILRETELGPRQRHQRRGSGGESRDRRAAIGFPPDNAGQVIETAVVHRFMLP